MLKIYKFKILSKPQKIQLNSYLIINLNLKFINLIFGWIFMKIYIFFKIIK